MWRSYLLCGLIGWTAATMPACAFVVYVSNEKSNTVSVIDTDKWIVTKTIKVGQRPRGIGFTRDGKSVLVAVGDDDKIEVIDALTQQVVDSLPSGPDPELFTQDAAGKILYVANENDNTVTVIDLEKRVRIIDEDNRGGILFGGLEDLVDTIVKIVGSGDESPVNEKELALQAMGECAAYSGFADAGRSIEQHSAF